MHAAVPSAVSPSFRAKSLKYLNGKEEERSYDDDDDDDCGGGGGG
jgi:hypothetical protein